MPDPTHRYVEHPHLGVRYLADFMAGSKRKERSILQNSKYRPIAKIIQHTEARSTVSRFVQGGDADTSWLSEEAERLRNRIADTDFERHTFDTNANYIERFATVCGAINWPNAEILPPGRRSSIQVHGVKVSVEFHVRLRRVTRTNKVKEGAGMLRYAKWKALSVDVAAWQSAFINGFLGEVSTDISITSERQLCLTIDAWAGICHPAPTDSVSRYQNMKAACRSIAEQWPNIPAPEDSVLTV